jgi:uncharacterized protein
MTNKEIIQNVYASFAAGDVTAVIARFSPEISWTEAAGWVRPGTFVGADSIVQNVFMNLMGDWDRFAAKPHELVTDGNTVVALGEYSGRYKATARDMRVPFVHVWKLRDGNVISFHQHTDTKLIADQIIAAKATGS